MTPQVLLDALRTAFLNLDVVSLLIIDECHRATGNHPYTKIMKVSVQFLHESFKYLNSTFSPDQFLNFFFLIFHFMIKK